MTTPDATDLPEHVRQNRAYWDGMADQWVPAGKRAWDAKDPYWGVWGLPEAELHLLPDDMEGLDAVELGCGTGYVSGWMARRGAHVVGIDNSEPHLHRPYFGLHKLDWTEVAIDPGGIEFTLPISEWFKLFRRTGFEVLDYLELRAPASAEGTPFQSPAEWAKQWPYEHVWKLRKSWHGRAITGRPQRAGARATARVEGEWDGRPGERSISQGPSPLREAIPQRPEGPVAEASPTTRGHENGTALALAAIYPYRRITSAAAAVAALPLRPADLRARRASNSGAVARLERRGRCWPRRMACRR